MTSARKQARPQRLQCPHHQRTAPLAHDEQQAGGQDRRAGDLVQGDAAQVQQARGRVQQRRAAPPAAEGREGHEDAAQPQGDRPDVRVHAHPDARGVGERQDQRQRGDGAGEQALGAQRPDDRVEQQRLRDAGGRQQHQVRAGMAASSPKVAGQ